MSDQFLVGHMQSITITNPAAGANFSYTLPDGRRYHVHGIGFVFDTAVAAATRNVCLNIDRGGAIIFAAISQATQIASLTNIYSFADGQRDMAAVINGFVTVPLSQNMWLIPGDILNSAILNIQAADQISDINLQVESFLLP